MITVKRLEEHAQYFAAQSNKGIAVRGAELVASVRVLLIEHEQVLAHVARLKHVIAQSPTLNFIYENENIQ